MPRPSSCLFGLVFGPWIGCCQTSIGDGFKIGVDGFQRVGGPKLLYNLIVDDHKVLKVVVPGVVSEGVVPDAPDVAVVPQPQVRHAVNGRSMNRGPAPLV